MLFIFYFFVYKITVVGYTITVTTKTYFLQHGVTVNDVGWLYHKYMKVKMFLTTTKQEDEFVKLKFHIDCQNLLPVETFETN